MKDAYSFDLDEDGLRHSYEAMFVAYLRTFARLGLQAVPVKAPTGPIGGDLSHEFHILADTGESALFYDAAIEDVTQAELLAADRAHHCSLTGLYAMEEEEHAKVAECPVPGRPPAQRRGIEVGHIFAFGTKYSASMA
jgi:prolyl-tRNA synthetase